MVLNLCLQGFSRPQDFSGMVLQNSMLGYASSASSLFSDFLYTTVGCQAHGDHHKELSWLSFDASCLLGARMSLPLPTNYLKRRSFDMHKGHLRADIPTVIGVLARTFHQVMRGGVGARSMDDWRGKGGSGSALQGGDGSGRALPWRRGAGSERGAVAARARGSGGTWRGGARWCSVTRCISIASI
ncbi:hypothetical protein B0H12DRAFT_1078229 [Mycena haematopus]|nr:hypothetical protein B0H12DRAFT_1078229 [Mycena haematopus]